MSKTVYKVYDATGAWLRTFNTHKEARAFCISRGRYNWSIKQITVK